MKKVSLILTAVMAAAGFSFISCDGNEVEKIKEVVKVDTVKVQVPVDNNWTRYQEAVDKQIKDSKKNDKAILLVAFGSTWQEAYDAFDVTIADYQKNFPSSDVYLSYSSAICINRSAAGENTEPRDFYAPNFWLHGLGAAKYEEITVQSLQVIPGEEFSRVVNYIKDFANNSLGDLDDKYLSEVTINLGMPLLATLEDVGKVASVIDFIYADSVTDGVMAFMGHGNPDSYDTYKANIRYNQLEDSLQALNPDKYFVGTVDAPENYKVQVLERMNAAGITSGKVYLHPLMAIAGDHAHNDMGGDDDAYDNGYEVNEEGEVEDTSWKCYFKNNGYECNDNTLFMKGLLEVDGIRSIWIEHTMFAEEVEDAYHSMFPEE